MKKKKKVEDVFRKQKDLKILKAFTYDGITGLEFIAVTIMDRKTGKVYAGNIQKYQSSLKEWRERHDD